MCLPDDPIIHGGEPGEIDIIDEETGAIIGRTLEPRLGMGKSEMDSLLIELELPEASEDDLNHLFGKRSLDKPSSDYPGSGDFS